MPQSPRVPPQIKLQAGLHEIAFVNPENTEGLKAAQAAFSAVHCSHDMPGYCCCEQPDNECKLTCTLRELRSEANLVQKHCGHIQWEVKE